MKSLAVEVLALAALSFAACAKQQGAEVDRPVVVAATWSLTALASTIGGETIDVVALAPPGVEPHDLELDAADLQVLSGAALVLVNSPGFQPSVDRAAEAAGAEVFTAIDAIDDPFLPDPHLWLDPIRWAEVASALGDRLDPIVPGARARATAVAEDLQALDAGLRAGLEGCARRTIVVAHDAFSYFSDRYGLDEYAIAGINPESEPTAPRLEELRALVDETLVTTIFTEPGIGERVAGTLARETGARVATLDPLELDDGQTYEARMRENLAALRTALDCP